MGHLSGWAAAGAVMCPGAGHRRIGTLRMKRRRWLSASVATLGCAILLAGCGIRGIGTRFVGAVRPSTNVVSEQHPQFDEYKVERIVVLPFEDHTGDPFVPPDAGQKLASFFYQRLKSYDVYDVEGPGSQEAAMVQIELVKPAPREGKEEVGEERETGKPSEEQREVKPKAAPAGRREEPPFDAAVSGVLSVYKEREGSWLSVLNPASVKFTVYMVSLKDGETLWKAEFNETQEALVDNLLKIDRFLKGGAGWQTSETLSRVGMERVVGAFPRVMEKEEAKRKGGD